MDVEEAKGRRIKIGGKIWMDMDVELGVDENTRSLDVDEDKKMVDVEVDKDKKLLIVDLDEVVEEVD